SAFGVNSEEATGESCHIATHWRVMSVRNDRHALTHGQPMTRKSGGEDGKQKFERMLTDVDELMRLRRRAKGTAFREARGQETGREATAAQYSGLAAFLDTVLPTEQDAEGRIARAVQMDEEMLRHLRRRKIDP